MSNPKLSKKFKEENKNNHVMKAIKEVAAIKLTRVDATSFNPHTQRWPYLANVTCEPSV